jgi:hypothetical protein
VGDVALADVRVVIRVDPKRRQLTRKDRQEVRLSVAEKSLWIWPVSCSTRPSARYPRESAETSLGSTLMLAGDGLLPLG